MSLDFPNAPTADQEFITPKVTFAWTGNTRWRRKSGVPPIPAVQPTLTQLIPDEGTIGDPNLTVRVLGTEFTAATELLWDGTAVTRTLVSATEMTTVVPLTGAARIVQVAARNDTLTSTNLPFEYLAAVPVTPEFFMLNPDHGLVNTAIPMTVLGQGFTALSKVWLVTGELPTTFVSDTELQVTMPAKAAPEVATVWVIENNLVNIPPAAGLPFTYEQLPLVLTSLNPGASIQGTISGGGPDVELNGSGFNANCWVLLDGVLTVTTYVSPTQLTANAVENRTVGTFSMRVRDTQTMVESNSLDWFVTSNQPPVLSSVSPNTAQQGSTIATLTVTGQNFVNGKRIKLDGVAKTTTYVNATTLTTTAVVCPVSKPKMDVEVEDCPGKLAVTLTALPGAVTIDPVIYPGVWPHSMQSSPYYGNCYCLITSAHDIAGCIVHMNGVPAEKTWTGDAGTQLWFTPGYQGGDPNVMQYFWVTVVKNGVPSANGGNLPVGSP